MRTWTAYDGANPYADFNGSGSLTDRYLYGPAIDMILANLKSDNDIFWYLTDHLGSVRDVANKTVTLVDHVKYDSFGRILYESSPTNGDRFKYTAREYDTATGLYYYRARYYDPFTGRFIAQDPIGFEAGDANIYRYVRNQPPTRTDPMGLEDIIIDLKDNKSYRWPTAVAVYDEDKFKPGSFKIAADDYRYHYEARSLQQIVAALNKHYAIYPYARITDVYIFAHGNKDTMVLGGYNVPSNDPMWRQIGQRIDGRIYLYSCQVGRNPCYLEAVAKASGREVVGYTWEIQTGYIPLNEYIPFTYDWWFKEPYTQEGDKKVDFKEVHKYPPSPPDPVDSVGGSGGSSETPQK